MRRILHARGGYTFIELLVAMAVVVVLTGVGSHGSMPERSVDPVVAGASLVMALQTIVSRNLDPHDPAVVTVGAINGGSMAIGHPLGSTGARMLTDLLYELERRGGRYGLQTICEASGTANTTIIERLG